MKGERKGGSTEATGENGKRNKSDGGGGKKKMKRRMRNLQMNNERRKINAFKNANTEFWAREVPSPLPEDISREAYLYNDPAAKEAKDSLSNLGNLQLFSNQEWAQTYFKPADNGRNEETDTAEARLERLDLTF